MRKEIERVKEMHKALGFKISETRTNLDKDQIPVNMGYIEEEFYNLIEELWNQNHNKIVKSSCDLIIALISNLVEMGLDSYLDPVFKIVMDANINKKNLKVMYKNNKTADKYKKALDNKIFY